MEISRRSAWIYGLLFVVWLLVQGWQVEEHLRVREAAKTDLRNRSKEIANTLSAVIRGMRFRGGVFQDRLEPVLNELVNSRTNEFLKSSELTSIALLNQAGEPLASAGKPIDIEQKDILQEGEHWGASTVIFVNPVAGTSLRQEGSTNPTVVLNFRDMTNNAGRDGNRGSQPRPEPRTNETSGSNQMSSGGEEHPQPPPPPPEDRPPDRGRQRRPGWMRGMDEKEFEALISKRELHGLVLAMSTENLQAVSLNDLWLRCVIAFFAGISAVVAGLAWRNVARTSELQIRLVRASEMNTHLKEMNLAAAGLAHETRNPLNIIRGMAQMLSRQPDAPAEIKEKSRAIVDETDKVTAQLNEFINYSRPREIRRAALPLPSAIQEVVRALNYDIDEKKIKLEVKGEPLSVEADEQLFRQALFNLLLNAVQALDTGGEIQVITGKSRDGGMGEAFLEVRDNGPGVPPERRKEIFKPYFTTHQKGTGLGLAVVQQIVLAHGWEIECLGNDPKGATFRITHLKVTV